MGHTDGQDVKHKCLKATKGEMDNQAIYLLVHNKPSYLFNSYAFV